ncbi:MAG: chromosomal replication initiator protein DnaA [Solirubrobacterales bacterium]
MRIDQLWSKIDAVFRRDVSDDVSDIWLSQLTPAALEDGVLYLTGSDRARSWIELRYSRALTECACAAADSQLRIELVADHALPSVSESAPTAQPATADWHTSPLHPRYTFDQFVIGRSNHIAHASALAVAEQPAQAFNPLFIYGEPGVGKTHLLHAIGNYLTEQAPELAVRFMTAENFAAVFRSVVMNNTVQEFKEDLRRTDVLLIDDVQFLQNKVKTEEEFFHTFNHLHESGRQLVITCDRTPRELESLADRLRERFESGLVVEVEQPDDRLRRAILTKRVSVDNIHVDDDLALDRIAQRVPANVRSLEGALIRVSAFASMRGEPVTSELVDELLSALHPHTAGQATEHSRPTVPIEKIQQTVADHFDLSVDDLLSASRARNIAGPRQIAMFLACEYSGQTLPMIARAFGRDHSTVVHARDKLRAANREDPAAAAAVDSLKTVLHSAAGGVDDPSTH